MCIEERKDSLPSFLRSGKYIIKQTAEAIFQLYLLTSQFYWIMSYVDEFLHIQKLNKDDCFLQTPHGSFSMDSKEHWHDHATLFHIGSISSKHPIAVNIGEHMAELAEKIFRGWSTPALLTAESSEGETFWVKRFIFLAYVNEANGQITQDFERTFHVSGKCKYYRIVLKEGLIEHSVERIMR